MRRVKRQDKYKSNFEADVAAYYKDQLEYEVTKIKFQQPSVNRTYNPDFTPTKIENLFIETKGKLSMDDRKKHLLLKDQHPDKEIVLLFQNSNNKITRRSNTTYGDWCDANDIIWFCWKTKPPPKTIKELHKICLSKRLLNSKKEASPLKESFQTKN
jgi:mannosyltransferase OCH1-like enzyme